jgi:hypothetical protein
MMILSTNGSKILPSWVTWLYFRAQYPSIQSVEAAIRNTMSAGRYHFIGISTKTAIESAKRRAVTWLGTLKTLARA